MSPEYVILLCFMVYAFCRRSNKVCLIALFTDDDDNVSEDSYVLGPMTHDEAMKIVVSRLVDKPTYVITDIARSRANALLCSVIHKEKVNATNAVEPYENIAR